MGSSEGICFCRSSDFETVPVPETFNGGSERFPQPLITLSVAALASASSILIPPGNSNYFIPEDAKAFNSDPANGRTEINRRAMVVTSIPRLGKNICSNNSMIAAMLMKYLIFSIPIGGY